MIMESACDTNIILGKKPHKHKHHLFYSQPIYIWSEKIKVVQYFQLLVSSGPGPAGRPGPAQARMKPHSDWANRTLGQAILGRPDHYKTFQLLSPKIK